MAYAFHDLVGGQAIADTSAVQKHPLGTRVRAYDPTYGEAEFVYLKGVAATAAGDLVTYESQTGATARSGAASKGPCAVAMSANVANQFGWYAVAGAIVALYAGAAVAGAIPYVTATAGAIDDAVVAGQGIVGAAVVSSAGAGLGVVQLDHPSIGAL